jgi:hypothetical protein
MKCIFSCNILKYDFVFYFCFMLQTGAGFEGLK